MNCFPLVYPWKSAAIFGRLTITFRLKPAQRVNDYSIFSSAK
jgi:hypothetical protein